MLVRILDYYNGSRFSDAYIKLFFYILIAFTYLIYNLIILLIYIYQTPILFWFTISISGLLFLIYYVETTFIDTRLFIEL